jgi:hypothetical protein
MRTVVDILLAEDRMMMPCWRSGHCDVRLPNCVCYV